MNKLIIFVFLLVASYGMGQNFRGTLIYHIDFELSQELIELGLEKDVVASFDTVRVSYSEEGFYKTINTNPIQRVVYNVSSKKLYAIDDSGEIINDADRFDFMDSDTDYSIKDLDTLVQVSGYDCGIIRVDWKSSYYDYYYPLDNNKLKMNPELFKDFKYDGFYDFLKISNALPVKIVKNIKNGFTASMSLLSINTLEVDSDLLIIKDLKDDDDLTIDEDNLEKVIAYSFEKNYADDSNDENEWLFIYLFNYKPYFIYKSNDTPRMGRKFQLEIDKERPTNYIEDVLLEEEEKNTVIFFGHDFIENDVLKIYSENELVESFTIDGSFGVKLDLKEKITLKLYREERLHSKYDFTFVLNAIKNFHIIEIGSPDESTIKNIVFNSEGEYTVTTP